MRNQLVILVAAVIMIVSMIAFNIRDNTGYAVKESILKGPIEETKAEFMPSDTSRSHAFSVRKPWVDLNVIPGTFGADTTIKVYSLNSKNKRELIKTLHLCEAWRLKCFDEKSIRFFISKGYLPGEYIAVVRDKNSGGEIVANLKLTI